MKTQPNLFNRLKKSGYSQSLWPGLLARIWPGLSKPKFTEHALVHPCVINGVQTLVYPRGLANTDPQAFRVIQEYARVASLELKEDQRSDFLEGIKRVQNKQLANVVSVLALSASLGLVSQPVAAAGKKELKLPFNYLHGSIHQNIGAAYLDLEQFNNDAELAAKLLAWLNANTSLQSKNISAPGIKKASSYAIAKMAFGGRIPKSVDVHTLKIYGLYNFNEKTVYLHESVDLDSTEGKGILLHELVHYIQYETGMNKNARCMQELEALAYTLEARFLDKHQHRHGITSSHVNKVSHCKS